MLDALDIAAEERGTAHELGGEALVLFFQAIELLAILTTAAVSRERFPIPVLARLVRLLELLLDGAEVLLEVHRDEAATHRGLGFEAMGFALQPARFALEVDPVHRTAVLAGPGNQAVCRRATPLLDLVETPDERRELTLTALLKSLRHTSLLPIGRREGQRLSSGFPGEGVFLRAVAGFARGDYVALGRAPAAHQGNDVVHRQLMRRKTPAAVVTDPRRTPALPPLAAAKLLRPGALATHLGLVGDGDEGAWR
jgi:hypothetical protein